MYAMVSLDFVWSVGEINSQGSDDTHQWTIQALDETAKANLRTVEKSWVDTPIRFIRSSSRNTLEGIPVRP